MKKIIILFILLPLFITGCFVDNGNYDYTNVDGIEISGIQDNYTDIISFQDVLSITPTLKTSYPESDLTFKWLFYDNSKYSDTGITNLVGTQG